MTDLMALVDYSDYEVLDVAKARFGSVDVAYRTDTGLEGVLTTTAKAARAVGLM
ncbi:hypothetical protein O4273_24050 [Rhodococcus ruber]|uniref:hypothetical protein n=1 Tax=Rhodococcus ruber TaxID=1830 RepID=UPI0022B38F99|nr:hypothetical protein [Rhodococcus ruber]MCZ4505907.1 hypothetical protein [Rhodococcus ruber]